MSTKPAYSVSSVDNALRIALFLQQEGPFRGSELAERLGIARSTAHRLLTMLVHRGFAVQVGDRRYRVGPAMRELRVAAGRVGDLRIAALAALQDLRAATEETVDLQILVGQHVRFVLSLESPQLLRVGNREGALLPAWRASGGKAMLARLSDGQVVSMLNNTEATPQDRTRLLRELRGIRQVGAAVNNGEIEKGVTAIARAVDTRPGDPLTALAVAMPRSRFRPEAAQRIAGALTRATERMQEALRDAPEPEPEA